jgi:hypothetical protein
MSDCTGQPGDLVPHRAELVRRPLSALALLAQLLPFVSVYSPTAYRTSASASSSSA